MEANSKVEEEKVFADAGVWMIEEYKNIAATHDKLRDVSVRLVNFALVLATAPVAVIGILFRSNRVDLYSVPDLIYVLAVFVGIGEMIIAISILDARLSQYRYARTVNLVRKYFADRHTELERYLHLPTSASVPKNTRLGFVGVQMALLLGIGAAFFGYGISGFAMAYVASNISTVAVFFVAFVVYVVAFVVWKQSHIERFDKSLKE